jgi:hypothetical protein
MVGRLQDEARAPIIYAWGKVDGQSLVGNRTEFDAMLSCRHSVGWITN